MIESFANDGLEELFINRNTKKISKNFHKKAIRILDMLDAARSPYEMAIPGFRFHEWKGQKIRKFSVDLNGPWRITFSWDGVNATNVDLENPH